MFNIKDKNTRTVILIGLAGGAAYFISKSSFLFTPIILSSLMKGLNLSATKSGFLMSQEMLTLSLSTLALATIVGKVSKQKLFMGGFLLLFLGLILTAASDSLTVIMVARMMVGIGGGMVATVANAAISSSVDPERGFAVALTVSGILSAIVMPLLTKLSDHFEHVGVFLCLALFAVLLVPFCRIL
ncbi:MAG: MFS transporter, partial [Proteobacteria bacterium]|nr:MFS transporter [Pseudomonadota bacterium]